MWSNLQSSLESLDKSCVLWLLTVPCRKCRKLKNWLLDIAIHVVQIAAHYNIKKSNSKKFSGTQKLKARNLKVAAARSNKARLLCCLPWTFFLIALNLFG